MEIISFNHLGKWGQCGNQLFEIAGVIGLCNRFGAKPALPTRWKYRDEFNIPDEYFQDVEPDYYISGHQKCYNPELLAEAEHFRIVNITEYLQSEKYFYDVRDPVKRYLTPKGTRYLGDNTVAIHNRRGDYVSHPYFQQYGPDYYFSAIQKYFPDPGYIFFVCSDDPEYCKGVFQGPNFIIEKRNVIDDLRILAGCRYQIIANSTFSWWGAYLSDSSLVIRPPKIFAGLYSKIRDESGYWPENWILHEGFKRDFTLSFNSHFNKTGADTKSLECLRKMADSLFLGSSFVPRPGLLKGKMGICIFFYHFSRIVDNKVYEDFAGELLDDVFEAINDKTSCDFENGLAGIGWGIDYLIQKGFVGGDADEILSEIDEKLLQKIKSDSHPKLVLNHGITGIGIYVLSRIKKSQEIIDYSGNKVTIDLLVEFLKIIDKKITILKRGNKFYSEKNPFIYSWDYFFLFGLLLEIYELSNFTQSVEKILLSLIEPLTKLKSQPNIKINRLILIELVEKLKRFKNSLPNDKSPGRKINLNGIVPVSNDNSPDIITKNLSSVSDLLISCKELCKSDPDVSDLQVGLIWLFRKIFQFSNLLDECNSEYRKILSRKIEIIYGKLITPNEPASVESHSLGLGNGLSGLAINLTDI
jgi:hypothetical protein